MDAPAVIVILQACQMLDPDAGGLVDGFRNELLAANAGWSMERLREWVPEMSAPADQAAARQELFAGGQHVATYTNNTTYFAHADWLGTGRVRSDMTT